MCAVIISDLHLSKVESPLTERFLQMLEVLPCYSKELYILGDLFEFWPGDDVQDPLAIEVIKALKNLVNNNVAVFFQQGNRDFLIGNTFIKNTGVQLLCDHQLQTIVGQQVLLMHGDLLCVDDHQYQRFRKIMHNSFLQWLWSITPMSWRESIVIKVRRKSVEGNSNKSKQLWMLTNRLLLKL